MTMQIKPPPQAYCRHFHSDHHRASLGCQHRYFLVFFFSHELCDLCVCSPFSEDTPVLVMVTKATITSYNNVLRSQFVCTMCINPLLSSPAALVYHFLGLGTFKCQAEIQSFSMLSSNIYSNITQCVQCLSSFLMVFLFASIFSFLDVIIILQQH